MRAARTAHTQKLAKAELISCLIQARPHAHALPERRDHGRKARELFGVGAGDSSAVLVVTAPFRKENNGVAAFGSSPRFTPWGGTTWQLREAAPWATAQAGHC